MEKKEEGFLHEKLYVIPRDVINGMKVHPITRLLHVTDIGYYPEAKGHYLNRPDGCPQHILIYCKEGEGWYRLGGEKCVVRKNQFVVIQAGTPHAYGASSNNPWSIYWVHFIGEQSEVFFDLFNRTCDIEPSRSSRYEDRERLFEEIMVNLDMGFGNEILSYTSLCLWYLLGSFRFVSQFREINKPKDIDTVQRLINFMKDNLSNSITLDEMAEQVNYSPAYIGTLFMKKTGMSLINYFNQLKIQRACRLLDFTDKKIKEIAYDLGFSDPFYFSKVFQKYMHMSPKDYRKFRKG